MEVLLKEMRERLNFLELQEQTEDIKSRKNEISLAIVRVQQRALEVMFCQCPYPQNAFNGTNRCTFCSKKIPLKIGTDNKQNNPSSLNAINFNNTFPLKETPKHGICKERNCEKEATIDYNQHGHWVCQYHYDKLSDYFDEEYR